MMVFDTLNPSYKNVESLWRIQMKFTHSSRIQETCIYFIISKKSLSHHPPLLTMLRHHLTQEPIMIPPVIENIGDAQGLGR